MPRFLYTPNENSPTYEIESDGNRGFVALHAVYDVHPEYKGAKKFEPIPKHYIDYISGDGWGKVLKHRDWLKLET